ncbi:MAG: O-antigen ligase family protein [bacterium]|nr:O-antigen ligase family protein [bacterium]
MLTGLLIAAFLIYAAISAIRPAWGLYAILALLPAYQIRFFVFGLPTTFLEGMLLILAVVTIFQSIKLKTWKTKFRGLAWPIFFILLFVAAGIVSILVSPVLIKALGVFKAYVLEGVLFWVLCLLLIDSKTKLYRCFGALGFLVAYLSVFGIYQFFTLYHLPPAWWGPGLEPRRVVSLYNYPNAVALIVTPILSFLTALVFLRHLDKNLPYKWLLIPILSGGALLFLSFSRGAWLGYIVSLLALLFFLPRKKLFVSLVLAAICLLLIIPGSRERLWPALLGRDPAGLERIKLWQTGVQIIKAQPIFGSGLMGFREWYGAYRPSAQDEILNYPHNFFLNFWIEMGLAGLISVLGLFYWTASKAKEIFKTLPETKLLVAACVCGLVALFVHGQLDAPFFKNDLAILFWFLLAIIPVLHSMNTSQET